MKTVQGKCRSIILEMNDNQKRAQQNIVDLHQVLKIPKPPPHFDKIYLSYIKAILRVNFETD